jgi:hypothetical protein
MFRLIYLLHFAAVTLICTAPVITYVGDTHLGIELHVGDSDDSEKDSEDEKESKDLISTHAGQEISEISNLPETYASEEFGILNEDHLDVFTPPPEL